ncbi:MAG: hypothetical protein Q8K28_17180 [Hoeflea sp.]|nr:hypothetical protein [Hoeflea sp.]
MVFSIVRTGNPSCEPDCPEWIAADGDIVADSADAFRAILTKAGDRKLPLLINSLGGRVDVAVTMGRLIRERAMTVEVARTDYLTCEPWDEKCEPDLRDGTYKGRANTSFGICNSACPLVLAGGSRRIASPLSRIGVHQTVTTQEKYRDIYRSTSRKLSDGTVVTEKEHVERQKIGTVTTTEMTEALRRELESYLVSMDIKPALIDLMQSTPPDDIRYLNDQELKAFGVATEIHEIEPLVGHRICGSRSRPKNCVVRR